MHSPDDFDPEKWTYAKTGGTTLAISPDGDCTVALYETADVEVALINNSRTATAWADLYVSENAPVSISDISLRNETDKFLFPDEDDDSSDEVYISFGSSADSAGSFMHPIELSCSRYTAHVIAQSIFGFLED